MTGTRPDETARVAPDQVSGGGARRLVLMRHAKAEPGGSGADHRRALAIAGRRQSVRVGEAMTAAGLVPRLALVSSALRTRQTWELVASRLDPVPAVVVTDDLYDCSPRELLAQVTGLDDAVSSVLVVGHEPTMSATAAFLAGPGSDAGAVAQARVGMPTSAYAVLSADAPWQAWERATARLEYLGRPAG